MSPYTNVLHKMDMCSSKKAARKPLEKTAVVTQGLTLCLEAERQLYTDWKLVKLPFLKTCALAGP